MPSPPNLIALPSNGSGKLTVNLCECQHANKAYIEALLHDAELAESPAVYDIVSDRHGLFFEGEISNLVGRRGVISVSLGECCDENAFNTAGNT